MSMSKKSGDAIDLRQVAPKQSSRQHDAQASMVLVYTRLCVVLLIRVTVFSVPPEPSLTRRFP